MSNPLYEALGNGAMPGGMGNFTQLMEQFKNFRSAFKGDAKQAVMNMINSGQISQSQLNQAQQVARQFQQMMGNN